MEDERDKKLAAGRDRLAKFQKKKKKKKEPKTTAPEKFQDTSAESNPSFLEERPNGGDSVDEYSAGSSDLLGSNSDILSSFSEIDQRSIGTDDLCQDSDASQLDAEVARVELGEARSRIHQLEESVLGKQTALLLLQNELSELRSKVNNNTDNNITTNGNVIEDSENPQVNGSNQEAELRAALEQYNIKIQEFQQALQQRDQVIEQLTANMQSVVQSRDAVQAEATAQTNQLSQYIQTLQDQLKQTGEALRNQSGEQMSSLAEELSLAQHQVTALQQNVADKDAIMKQLADRYTQKAQEVIELAEERDDLKRKSLGEIAALKQKLNESTGEASPLDRDDSLLKLQAELDESYGSQIVMIKQQLDEKHRQELGLWKQRYNEMERIAAASSDSNLMRTELENQLKEANSRLAEKDNEILKARGDNRNLNLKLTKLLAAHQKQLDEMEVNHRNEMEYVREEVRKRTQEHLEEVKQELESTQGQLDTSLSELEEERQKSADAEDELAEKALNSSSLRDNLTKEIGILATELNRKDEEIEALNQVRTNLQEQLNQITSAREESIAQYQLQINDLSTEYSKLQGEMARLRDVKESSEDVDQDNLRSEINEEIRAGYEDRIDQYQSQMKDISTEYSKLQGEMARLRAEKESLEAVDQDILRSKVKEELQAEYEERMGQYQSQMKDISTEYSKLQVEMTRLTDGRESSEAVDKDALPAEIEAELRAEYEDSMDDQNFAHEAAMKQLRNELNFELENALNRGKLALQTQFEQKLENASVTKQHEFVTELQKVREELENKFEVDFNEKLEGERANWVSRPSGPLREGDQESKSNMNRLQAEVQELSEARDALLTQVDSTTHEKEALQEELMQVMTEKDTLVEMAVSPKEWSLSSTASTVDDAQLMDEVEVLRDSLTRMTQEKKDLERILSELENSLAVSVSERQNLTEEIEGLKLHLVGIEEAAQLKVTLGSMIEQTDQLLTEKEELQHRVEAQEKANVDLKETVSQLEDSLAASERERRSLTEEIVGMKPQLTSIKETARLEDTLESMTKHRDQLLTVEEELQHQLEARQKVNLDLEKTISQLQNSLVVSEEENQSMTGEIEQMNQLIEESVQLKETMEFVIKHRDQLLTEKEDLQHRFEAQEKEHEGEMLEIIAGKEAAEAELEKVAAEMTRTRKMSESSSEIEALQETLSELARLQEKASKVDLLEGELQALRGRLQDLEEQVCLGEEGSDSDKLEVLQDQLVSQQQVVSGLTEELRLAQEEVGALKGQGGDLSGSEEEMNALQLMLEGLQRENECLKEAKGALEQEFGGKITELDEMTAQLGTLETDLAVLKSENESLTDGVQGLKALTSGKDNEIKSKVDKIDLLENQLEAVQAELLGMKNGDQEVGGNEHFEGQERMEVVDNTGDCHVDRDIEGDHNEVHHSGPEISREELTTECNHLRCDVSEKERKIQELLAESSQKASQIQASTNDIELMTRVSDESAVREQELNDAVNELESALGERKNEMGLVKNELGGLDARLDNLGEQVSLLEAEKGMLMEQIEDLDKKLETKGCNMSSLEETLAEVTAERDLYLEQDLQCERDKSGVVLQESNEVDDRSTNDTQEKANVIPPTEDEDLSERLGVVDNGQSEGGKKVEELSDEIETLKEKLGYVERESMSEKKEYDNRLVLTEAELMKSNSLQAVLVAQMNAQKKMFDEDAQRMMKEIEELQAEVAKKPAAPVNAVDGVGEVCDLQEVVVELPKQAPTLQEEVLQVQETLPKLQDQQVPIKHAGVEEPPLLIHQGDADYDIEGLWQEVVGLSLEDIPEGHDDALKNERAPGEHDEAEKEERIPEVNEELLHAEQVGEELSSPTAPETSIQVVDTNVENLWQEVVGASLDAVPEVQNGVPEAEELPDVQEEVLVAQHVSQSQEGITKLAGRIHEGVVTNKRTDGNGAMLPTFHEEPFTNEVDKEFEELWNEVGQLKEESKAKEDELLKMEQHVQLMSWERDDALREVQEMKMKLRALLIEQQQKEKELASSEEELNKVGEQLEGVSVEKEIVQGQRDELESQLSGLQESLKQLETKEQENTTLQDELVKVKEELGNVMVKIEEIQGWEAKLEEQVSDLKELPNLLESREQWGTSLEEELARVRNELDSVSADRKAIQRQKADLESQISDLEESTRLLEREREKYCKEVEELRERLPEIDESSNEEEKASSTLQTQSVGVEEQLEGKSADEHVEQKKDLENQSMDQGHESDSDRLDEEVLSNEIRSLRDELEETKAVYSIEQSLLKEALKGDNSRSCRPDDEIAKIGNDGQVIRVTDLLDQREQQEKEMLTEKNLRISVLQKANARQGEEIDDLRSQLREAEERLAQAPGTELPSDRVDGEDVPGTVSQELGHTTGEDGQDLADRLDESIAREELLLKEKDLLLEKIAEQEEIHRRLVNEKEELQRQLSDKKRLEELLLERDRLEQELARQKTNTESDLHDLEVQLTQRENHLLREKCQLQNELKQKDLLLRRWEVGYREHQLKLRSQEMLLERQYSEQLARVQDQLEEGQASHLEKLKAEIERRHAEAIARLRRDLHQEFALRGSRLNESHLSDITTLKSQHNSQLKELLAEAEARNETLRQELEAERQTHNQENGPSVLAEVSQDATLNKLESLKQCLDEGNEKLLHEIIKDKEDKNDEKMDQMKSDLEAQHKQELESLKATAEAVYSSQLDEQLASYEQEKSQALVEQLGALQAGQEEELDVMRKNWADREEEYERRVEERDDIDGLSTGQLIDQLQKRLIDEHQQLLQDLTQEYDQVSLEYLEALRSKMEGEHRKELERKGADKQIEGDIEEMKKQWEESPQLDDESLIAERERVVALSEELKKKLDTVHSSELANLRASIQAEYDMLIKAKEDLAKTRPQSEQTLKQELEGIRDAFEDLQRKYVEERELAAASLMGGDLDATEHLQQLQSEVDELQKELTRQRMKLQDDHAEELSKLKAYFETELANTEEKWQKELERAEDLKGANVSLESSLEEQDVFATKRPDLPHSLMTLTHISDVESSPPRSPVKTRDIEAEFRQQLRNEVERDYQKGLENLRNELENEHKVEISCINLDYELKHEQDLRQEKDALKRKHEHEAHMLEMKHLEALDNLRKELDDHLARELARARMEAAGDMAKMVEEERENAKEDYKQQLAEAVDETRLERDQQSAKDLEDLRTRLEEEHRLMVEQLTEDQESDVQERIQQEVGKMKEQLVAEHEENKKKALEELGATLEDSKTRAVEESFEKHRQEVEQSTDREVLEQEGLVEEKIQQDVERMKERLVAEHEEDKKEALEGLAATLEDVKVKEVEELVARHQQEVKELNDREVKERDEYEEDKKDALEQLMKTLETSKAKEMEELKERHQKECGELKAAYDERWMEEKAKVVQDLEEQLMRSDDTDSILEQLREVHEQEKAQLREELANAHMEEFKDIHDRLEEEHMEQLTEMRDTTKQAVEDEFAERLRMLEDELEGEKSAREEMRGKYEEEVRAMNERNEEITRKMNEEFDEQIKVVALDSAKKIDNAKMELEAAHQQEIQEIEARHLASLDEEKGSIDALLQERDGHWKSELEAKEKQHKDIQQKLLDEINQVQEEKAALVKNSLELAKRQRESEETNNLISMLRSDIDNLTTERDLLQQANNNLLLILSQAIKAVISADDTISKKIQRLDGRRSSSVGDHQGAAGGGDDTPSNTSILSNDEGLELSQQLSESIFAGPELDSDGEELIINATSQLQASLQALLGRMDRLPEEPAVRAEQAGVQAAPPPPQEDILRKENEELEGRLEEESRERQRLTGEMDRLQGLLQGLQTDRDELYQSLKAMEEEKHGVIVDLETAKNSGITAEKELQRLRVQHDQLVEEVQRLTQQQNHLQEDEQDLVEEIASLKKENDALQKKAKKERDTLQSKLQELEAHLEEQASKHQEEIEAKNLQVEDLRSQMEAADKIRKADKEFLKQQTIEREQERDEFQKEIERLEGRIDKEKTNGYQEEELKEQLRELERENVDLRQAEEELAHEREALQKQCYDQLHQVSALQSKLDAQRHGLGGEMEELPPSDVDEESEASLASVTLTQQLEQEKEALERKNSEIKALEEQLDQFRESLVGKEDEISQLNLQLTIADKAGTQREENLKGNDTEVLQLKVQLDQAEERVLELQQHLYQATAEPRANLQDEQDRERETHIEELKQLEAQYQGNEQRMRDDHGTAREEMLAERNEYEEKLQARNTEVLQLKIQLDRAEETILALQQQAAKVPAESPQGTREVQAYRRLEEELEQIREDHHKAVEEFERNHREIVAGKEEEHQREVAGMLAAQEADWEKIRELEGEYKGKMQLIGNLSPGKTLQQKLEEIKAELTAQHQEHVADIQRTMAREADERVEQMKAQTAQELVLKRERHQHELEEAILRTNRDLMAAHAEEVSKLREEHRAEMERLLAASPANLSQFSDMSQLVQTETYSRGRPHSSFAAQADSGLCAGDGSTEGLSDKLKTIISRLKGEGLSLLSLSELRYLHDQTAPRTPLQAGASLSSIQDAWDNERRALKDGLQALSDLVTQMNTAHLTQTSDPSSSDWRGDLLHAIQHVFHCQRDALRAELATNVAMSGDQNITQLQLLERRIRDQENFHKSAVEQIYGADRASILGETRELHMQNTALREELQRSRQKLTQQLNSLEDVSQKRERQLKRQLETMEHKYRQERILVEDLRTSLTLEKEKTVQLSEILDRVKGQYEEQQEEVGDLLTKIDKQTADHEALESRLTDVTAAFEAERSQNQTLNTTMADERKASRTLQESFETENHRLTRARTQEQRIIKELHREIQVEKDKLVQAEKIAEQEALRSTTLSRELEAIRDETETEVQHEKAKFTELKTALDVEKSRCQELKTALQREQALNVQLHSTIEQERQANTETSLKDKSALSEAQASLDKLKAKLLKAEGQCRQLENSMQRKEGIVETERRQHKESLAQERAGARQLKSTLDGVQSQLQETRRQLSYEQEKNARLTAEKERLKHSQEHVAEGELERELQREREREAEKKRQLEREREKEMDRQKLRDLQLEQQLAQQKIEALEGEVEDWRGQAQQALEELQTAQEKKIYEEDEEDLDMQRTLEQELQNSLERLGPAGRESGSTGHGSNFGQVKEQLESIRQRLQLIAVRENEGLALLRRLNQAIARVPATTAQEMHMLERNLQEATAELRQIHGALILQTETSNGVPASQSRLNTRLLNQNAELTDYITKLSEDKSAVRRQVAQLEEQLWNLRHRSSTSPRSGHRDISVIISEERSSWEREKMTIQNSLRQAEREIIRLKMDLERSARESDMDLVPTDGHAQGQSKYQRLYGKYLRAESFRKSLVYQKRYLLLLLGGFQHTEEAALALIAKMGGYPNPSNMPPGSNRHSPAFTKFRSAVRVVIAVSRLKYLKNKWQRARGSSRAESRGESRAASSRASSHATPPGFLPSHPLVKHSSASGTTPPGFLSPGRIDQRFGPGASLGTPPVRERSVPAGSVSTSLPDGATHSGPHSFRSSPSGRRRQALSPNEPMDDSEASISKQIRKLDNFHQKMDAGSLNESSENRRYSYSPSQRRPPSQRR